MKLGVIILAAGASSRMGRPKMLLPWGEGTVLSRLLRQWSQVPHAQLAVVLAPSPQGRGLSPADPGGIARAREGVAEGVDAIGRELDRLHFPLDQRIVNLTPERGMFSSIQAAANWTDWREDLTHWAISLGDQPLVRRSTLHGLIEFATARETAVCQPSRGEHGRHPVILPARIFRSLTGATAINLKQFLLSGGVTVARWECEDVGLDLDLDAPADYERALASQRVGPAPSQS